MNAQVSSAPTLSPPASRPRRPSAHPEVPRYVLEPDPAFAWTSIGRRTSTAGTVHVLKLTSQVWQGHPWEHDLRVYKPEGLAPSGAMLLMLVGGSNRREIEPDDDAMGFELARLCGAPCALLRQVPNQPLFGGMMEDALIAESFLRYLATGDDDWPLLFPMVKSALRAMDALQDWSDLSGGRSVGRFVLAGASKRGWTSWLTAAFDRRVAAIASMVFDTLNIPAQNARQVETWGRNSDMVEDYRSRGLLALDEDSGAPRLWRMVDPYTYRDRLELPKLIVNGTNDRYWTLDALDLYWDDLRGPKQVVYVPNADHGPAAHHELARHGVGALFRHAVAGRPLPAASWVHDDAGGDCLRLTVASRPEPTAAQLWVAHADGRDFRAACWEHRPMHRDGASWRGEVSRPRRGHVALFAEMTFEVDGLTYQLSSQIRQVGPPGAE